VGEHGSFLDRRQQAVRKTTTVHQVIILIGIICRHITPDPNSNPVIYYLKWVVSETVGGFNAGIMNDAYTDGITCPYEIPDQWQYEYDRQW
jgi:hypothetical protein